MTAKTEEWYERARKATKDTDRLELVDEVAASDEAPEYLRAAARRAAASLTVVVNNKQADATDRHRAEHHYQSFKFAFPE